MPQFLIRVLAILALPMVLLVGACGGGGIGSVAGIEGTGISSGSTSGFGSIIVNGVDFDTDGAEVIVNGQPGRLDQLIVGDVVRVEGRFNDDGTGTANRVIFNRDLDGPVEAHDIDPLTQTGTVTALGQTVVITGNTLFANGVSVETITDPTLPKGGIANLIAVSGFLDGEGRLIATTIRQGSDYVPTTPVDVNGEVEMLDVTLQQFRINDLLIDYSGLASGPDESDDVFQNGAFVEVIGTRQTPGTLQATSVVVRKRRIDTPGLRLEIEGIIANLDSNGNFTLNGQPVNAGAVDTSLENGMRIEVEGTIDESGNLPAENIIEIQPSNTQVQSLVQLVNGESRVIIVLGQEILITELTQFIDESTVDDPEFGLDDLQPEETVLITANYSEDGLIANQVERIDPLVNSKVTGLVSDFTRGERLVIAGITVLIGDTEYINTSNNPFSENTFFTQLESGERTVRAIGLKTSNNSLLAESLQIIE